MVSSQENDQQLGKGSEKQRRNLIPTKNNHILHHLIILALIWEKSIFFQVKSEDFLLKVTAVYINEQLKCHFYFKGSTCSMLVDTGAYRNFIIQEFFNRKHLSTRLSGTKIIKLKKDTMITLKNNTLLLSINLNPVISTFSGLFIIELRYDIVSVLDLLRKTKPLFNF